MRLAEACNDPFFLERSIWYQEQAVRYWRWLCRGIDKDPVLTQPNIAVYVKRLSNEVRTARVNSYHSFRLGRGSSINAVDVGGLLALGDQVLVTARGPASMRKPITSRLNVHCGQGALFDGQFHSVKELYADDEEVVLAGRVVFIPSYAVMPPYHYDGIL